MLMIVAAALRARRNTRELFKGQLIGSLIALPIGWILIRLFGVPGTALGMLVSYVLMTLLLWRTYRLAATSAGISPSTIAPAPSPCLASGPLLQRVLNLLDQSGIPYCITHGHQQYPQVVCSDVDLIVPAEAVRKRLAPLLHANQPLLGAQIVQWIRQDSDYIVLMGVGQDGVEHLCLDVSSDYELCNRVFLKCEEILGTRRRSGQFWIPSPELEFTCCLLRRIVKQHLTAAQAARLSELYAEAPEASVVRLTRFFSRADRTRIEFAAASGDWRAVERRLPALQSHLLLATALRQPLSFATRLLVRQWRRLQRWCRPRHGLHVVFLGPDGAGKSSVVRAVREQLGPAFFNTACRSFPPALLNRSDEATFSTRPHEVPPRSPIASTVRAVGYWLAYHTIGHLFTIRVDRARCGLSLHDRHFVDTLVDPRRYRYAGPRRLLDWIWRITPKPDLLIVLAPPPQTIQARKPEVTRQETARQCLEYRALARDLPMASVIDTSTPLAQTMRDVARILVNHMAARTRKQLRLTRESTRQAEVRRALGVMTSDGKGNSWMITGIGSGNQAYVYEASLNDKPVGSASADASAATAPPRPLKRTLLIVKLFRPNRPDVAIAAAEEFESLRQLHSLLDDLTIDGWRIRVPTPLLLCNQPRAIIMTKVAGRPLNSLLAAANGNVTPDANAISHVLASALERFWSAGRRIYGDFTLSNVLCDPANHQISLVDPGMPEASYECPEIARRWYPASRDVAFLIFDTATSIRRNLGHPTLRRHHWQVVVQVLKAIVGKLRTQESQREFLAEVDACTRVHLKRIAVSWSLSGSLHFLVRCIASLRMRLLFSRLRNASGGHTQPGGAVVPDWAEELRHDEPNT
jgi:thymidylate kinase